MENSHNLKMVFLSIVQKLWVGNISCKIAQKCVYCEFTLVYGEKHSSDVTYNNSTNYQQCYPLQTWMEISFQSLSALENNNTLELDH